MHGLKQIQKKEKEDRVSIPNHHNLSMNVNRKSWVYDSKVEISMNHNQKIIATVALVAIISVGIVVVLTPIPRENGTPFFVNVYASWGQILIDGVSAEGFYIAQELGPNTTTVEIGNINDTTSLDGAKYGLEVTWNDDRDGTVELCVLLAFTLPAQINQTTIADYYANITLYVTIVHNGTYNWAFRIPAVDGPLSDGMGGWVSWWRDGTVTDNETFAVNVIADNYVYFIPYVNEENELYAKFTVIVDGDVDDFTQLLIDFGKLTLYQ